MEHFGPKAAQMLQMVSFDIALNHYGPKAVQMLLIASLRIILDYFGPRAAQMLEVISSGAILDQFGCPKKSTYFKSPSLVSFWSIKSIQIHSNPSKSYQIRRHSVRRFRGCVNTWHSFPFGRAIHSGRPFHSNGFLTEGMAFPS